MFLERFEHSYWPKNGHFCFGLPITVAIPPVEWDIESPRPTLSSISEKTAPNKELRFYFLFLGMYRRSINHPAPEKKVGSVLHSIWSQIWSVPLHFLEGLRIVHTDAAF